MVKGSDYSVINVALWWEERKEFVVSDIDREKKRG